jgi:hypothetical protein
VGAVGLNVTGVAIRKLLIELLPIVLTATIETIYCVPFTNCAVPAELRIIVADVPVVASVL